MPHVPGLRSPYAKVGRLFYFGRMLDKIRLHAAGKLPPEYIANLGEPADGRKVFDVRCCHFLGVSFADVTKRTLTGGTAEEILAWAHAAGKPRNDEECEIWSMFMAKRGWRDAATATVQERTVQFNLTDKSIHTMFDFIDYDEGRDPAADRLWEKY